MHTQMSQTLVLPEYKMKRRLLKLTWQHKEIYAISLKGKGGKMSLDETVAGLATCVRDRFEWICC